MELFVSDVRQHKCEDGKKHDLMVSNDVQSVVNIDRRSSQQS